LLQHLVLGFLPILSFLLNIEKVPNDEILILFDLMIDVIIFSKISSIIFCDKFFEKPTFLKIFFDKSFLVKFLLVIIKNITRFLKRQQ